MASYPLSLYSIPPMHHVCVIHKNKNKGDERSVQKIRKRENGNNKVNKTSGSPIFNRAIFEREEYMHVYT